MFAVQGSSVFLAADTGERLAKERSVDASSLTVPSVLLFDKLAWRFTPPTQDRFTHLLPPALFRKVVSFLDETER